MKTYTVTIDIPAGISSGHPHGEDLQAASDTFARCARGTFPNGTVVRLWEDDTLLDTATVTEETKAAERARDSAALAAIVERANRRAQERLDTGRNL